jgi:hypothetical protein
VATAATVGTGIVQVLVSIDFAVAKVVMEVVATEDSRYYFAVMGYFVEDTDST